MCTLSCQSNCRVQCPVIADMVYLGTLYSSIIIHVNVGPVLVWDVKEPLRTTSTLAVTTLSASIERLTWCKCSETD